MPLNLGGPAWLLMVATRMSVDVEAQWWGGGGGTTADRVAKLLQTSGDALSVVRYDNGSGYWRRPDGLFSRPVEVAPCLGAQADGGWRCSASSSVIDVLLDADSLPEANRIDVIGAGDEEAFGARFEAEYRHQRPVVIRSKGKKEAWLGKGKKARTKKQLLSRKGLLTNGGKMKAVAGLSADIVIKSGNGYIPGALGDYIGHYMPAVTGKAVSDNFKGEPFSLFHREQAITYAELLGQPAAKLVLGDAPAAHLRAQELIWLIGPPRSGTAWHRHPDAWVALAYGRKRWMLYPPNATVPGGSSGPNMYPTFGVLEWWDHVRPKLSVEQMPIEAIQEPGDIMYVPEGWHHAVINIDDVVGISYQSMDYVRWDELNRCGTFNAGDGSQLEDRLAVAEEKPDQLALHYYVAESLREKGRHA